MPDDNKYPLPLTYCRVLLYTFALIYNPNEKMLHLLSYCI
jgi:hypothetical protein